MVPLEPSNMQNTTNLPTNGNPNEHSCNLIYPSYLQYAGNVTPTMSQAELAMYHHQSMGSPPKSTFLQAIRAHPTLFSTFPGLNYELIHKHLPLSTATMKGHMILRQQGLESTAQNNRRAVMDARLVIKDMCPTEHICSAVEDEIYCFAVIGDQNENTIYSDLTGQFPVRSFEGMSYIFVAYVYKLNAIMLRPMKSREDDSMVQAFTSIYSELEAAGHKPKLHVLDNECSRAVQNFLISQGTARHNVESHNHRANAAEPAVKTAKYHIIAHIATLDDNCPIQLWSKMLPQMQDTLNMLRTSRQPGGRSTYEELNGAFDWGKTPLAPLGTKGMIFIHPETRHTFAPHCDKAFVVGRARHHHKLLEFYVPTTKGYRITGTYRLDPTHWTMPTVSEQDKTIVAASDLLEMYEHIPPPSAKLKQKHIAILKELNTILSNNGKRVVNTGEPRVDGTQPPRVVAAAPPRVRSGMSTSNSPTCPRNLRTTPRVHQRLTRSNTPMPTVMEVAEPPRTTLHFNSIF